MRGGQNVPRRGKTSTHSPACKWSFDACTTRKQFPRTTAPISPEPSQRSTSTLGSVSDSPSGQLTRAGRKCATPPFSSTGCASFALNSRQGLRIAAAERFDRGHDEQLECHHRRNGISRQSEDRLSAAPSENHRLARTHRHRIEKDFGAEYPSTPARRDRISRRTRRRSAREDRPRGPARFAREARRLRLSRSLPAMARRPQALPARPAKCCCCCESERDRVPDPRETSSSPVERIATRGRRLTSMRARPTSAAMASSA